MSAEAASLYPAELAGTAEHDSLGRGWLEQEPARGWTLRCRKAYLPPPLLVVFAAGGLVLVALVAIPRSDSAPGTSEPDNGPVVEVWPVPMSGCGAEPPANPGAIAHVAVNFGGSIRTLHIIVPTTYNHTDRTPVVIGFHGWGGSGRLYTSGGWRQVADANNVLVVGPDGLSEGMHASWNGAGTTRGNSPFRTRPFEPPPLTCCTVAGECSPTRYPVPCYPSCRDR
eukprot:SAG31_NODE_2790_length_5089_cov_1.785772_3_plen_226_part_00